LARAELDDGTPSASVETRAWLDELAPPAVTGPGAGSGTETMPARFAYSPPGPLPSRDGSSDVQQGQDAWDRAQEFLRAGEAQGAIATLARAVREADTGRERFLRTLQQAELCMTLGRPGIAAPLLEDLVQQIEDFRLEHWEDPALCSRVYSALYRCLRHAHDDRAGAIYKRLCQLDIGQAILIADEPGA
jgi:hypothetical protein